MFAFSSWLWRVLRSVVICIVANKNIRNMHADLVSQITDILHFNDNNLYATKLSLSSQNGRTIELSLKNSYYF